MTQATPNKKALLKEKGFLYVLDESADQAKWVEVCAVDNFKEDIESTPIELKTASGDTIYRSLILDPKMSFDLYHPGDLTLLEQLFRGVVSLEENDGATEVGGEQVAVSFRAVSEAAVLPNYNGDGSAVTVTSVVLASDVTTTYTVTDDYTLVADPLTGMTLIVHVPTGDIPLDAEVIVTYSYTPLASRILRPVEDGDTVPRFFMVVTYPDLTDTTKYRRYFLPHSIITSPISHAILGAGTKDGMKTPNIMPVTVEYEHPELISQKARWYWIDTHNAPDPA